MKALMIAAIMPAPITTPTGGQSAHARPIRKRRGSRIGTVGCAVALTVAVDRHGLGLGAVRL